MENCIFSDWLATGCWRLLAVTRVRQSLCFACKAHTCLETTGDEGDLLAPKTKKNSFTVETPYQPVIDYSVFPHEVPGWCQHLISQQLPEISSNQLWACVIGAQHVSSFPPSSPVYIYALSCCT